MSFPRYPKYKPSGVEWLGDVPEHWNVALTKRFLTVQSGDMISASDESESGYPLIGGNGLRANTTKFNTPKDTLVIGRVGALCGCVHHISEPFWASEHAFRVIERKPFSKRFFFHVLSALQLNQFAVKTAQPLLNTTIIETQWITAPSIPEQVQIAAVLDRETAKIDGLVGEQRRLIELLKEKRQAVISHAVTKGLNPRAPLKPSGIEWLGDVPEHWRVGKCGFYLTILSGFAFPSAGFSEDETDTKLLRGINVGVSRLRWDETVYWRRLPDDGLDIYEMKDGDLVIGMDRPLIGEGMRVAKVKESDLPCLLLQRVASLKTGERLNGDYLLGLLSSEMFAAHFSPDTTGVSVPHISPEQIGNFTIPVPPVTEQGAIVAFINSETAKLDALTAEAEKGIELLQKRRTALISAAVTGKIDVRGLAETEVL